VRKRNLFPLVDVGQEVTDWCCSACSWKMASPKQLEPASLNPIWDAFDAHVCDDQTSGPGSSGNSASSPSA